jgi:hypothetical protein
MFNYVNAFLRDEYVPITRIKETLYNKFIIADYKRSSYLIDPRIIAEPFRLKKILRTKTEYELKQIHDRVLYKYKLMDPLQIKKLADISKTCQEIVNPFSILTKLDKSNPDTLELFIDLINKSIKNIITTFIDESYLLQKKMTVFRSMIMPKGNDIPRELWSGFTSTSTNSLYAAQFSHKYAKNKGFTNYDVIFLVIHVAPGIRYVTPQLCHLIEDGYEITLISPCRMTILHREFNASIGDYNFSSIYEVELERIKEYPPKPISDLKIKLEDKLGKKYKKNDSKRKRKYKKNDSKRKRKYKK